MESIILFYSYNNQYNYKHINYINIYYNKYNVYIYKYIDYNIYDYDKYYYINNSSRGYSTREIDKFSSRLIKSKRSDISKKLMVVSSTST